MSDAYYTLVESFFTSTLAHLRGQEPDDGDDPTAAINGSDGSIVFFLFKRRTGPNSINYDESMARALELNSTAQRIFLILSPRCTILEEWSSLLRVVGSGQGGESINTVCIANNSSLDSMFEVVLGEDHRRETMETLTRSVLQKIQPLPSLEALDMRVSKLPVTVLSSFLDNAPPLFGSLCLTPFAFQESDEMSAFAAAVERRNKIKPMSLNLPGLSVSTVELLYMFAKRNVSFETMESCFVFRMDDEVADGGATLRRRIFLLLLKLLSHFKFHNVHFRGIQSEQVFYDISRNIPKKAVIMEVEVQGTDGWTSVAEAKQSFLAALKRNVRLLSVEVEAPDGVAFLDETEQRKIQFYIHRNRRFLQWADNPKTLPTNLWPRALRLAAEAGHEELYRRLLAVSSDLGTIKRTRKRKRLDRYDPGH